jgi:hypothetical protein
LRAAGGRIELELSKEDPNMMHLLWVVPLVTGLAVMWLGRFHGLALLVFLVCGCFGLAHLVVRPRGMAPPPAQQDPDTRADREVPPHPGW